LNFIFHVVGGWVFATIVIALLGGFSGINVVEPPTWELAEIFARLFILYVVATISAILPDVDVRTSWPWRFLNLFLAVFLFVFIVFLNGFSILTLGIFLFSFIFWYFALSKIIIPSHREFFHSILFTITWGILLFFFSSSFTLAIVGMIAMYSHLVLDKIPFKLW